MSDYVPAVVCMDCNAFHPGPHRCTPTYVNGIPKFKYCPWCGKAAEQT